MFYTVYKITNLKNDKIYIGTHQTNNLDDGYMGSGTVICNAVNKHGKENFKKEILHFLDSKEEMYLKEKEIVNEEFLLREDTYNLRLGGMVVGIMLIRTNYITIKLEEKWPLKI